MAKSYWKDDQGRLLVDFEGEYFYDEICCCDECPCCTGSFAGFVLKIVGVVDGNAGKACNCGVINGSYCVPHNGPSSPCTGNLNLPGHIQCSPPAPFDLDLGWSLSEFPTDFCSLSGEWDSAACGPPAGGCHVAGSAAFAQPVACNDMKGLLGTGAPDDPLHGCFQDGSTLEVVGTC